MRRSLLALAALLAALAFGLTACNDAQEQQAAPETVTGTEPLPTETVTQTETGGGLTGNPTAGKAVFTGASGCIGCHTLADAGATGVVGPNLDEAKPAEALVIDRVTHGQGQMPSFGSSLTPQQIADVAAYVHQATGG